MLVHAIPSNATYDFAADVRAGLTRSGQKELPSKYLYDDVGSALFEVISRLPEYGLTRADERLLRRHADEIVDRLAGRVAGGGIVSQERSAPVRTVSGQHHWELRPPGRCEVSGGSPKYSSAGRLSASRSGLGKTQRATARSLRRRTRGDGGF